MVNHKTVIVTGLIGSGKSTLSKELSQALGEPTLYLTEPDELKNRNPYLPLYYENPERWAFAIQIHLLALRQAQHLRAQWYVLDNAGHAVLDSSYWQDTAFARVQRTFGYMNELEFDTYSRIYKNMTSGILYPNVCVRVLTNPRICLERVAKRSEIREGRKCESAVTLEYLQQLDKEINEVMKILHSMGVVIIDMPWDEDRSTVDDRRVPIESLAERIRNMECPDPFLDIHRRTT